jgi:hypothetical protein
MLSKEELEFWAGQSSYTLHDAAFLWRDKDPQVKIPDSDRITSIVLNMLFSATCSRELEVTGGIIPGFTIRSEWMERETRTSPKITHRTRVSRESLIKLAKNQSVKPFFLFPGDQQPEECSLKIDTNAAGMPIEAIEQQDVSHLGWIDRDNLMGIKNVWKAFLFGQNEYVKNQHKQQHKTTKELITQASLKVILITANNKCGNIIPVNILNNLKLKYSPSREKEGFICDVIKKMALQDGPRDVTLMRDEILYKKIMKIPDSSE